MDLPWKELPSIDQITDKIYLGNESGAHNKDLLQELKITHILTTGNYIQQKFPKDFKYKRLFLSDKPTADLIAHLQTAFNFIEESDHVLVHCSAGVSRSSSIVMAYLMIKNKWKYSEAYEYVKARRAIVCPNEGFVSQLKKLEELIKEGKFNLGPETSTSLHKET